MKAFMKALIVNYAIAAVWFVEEYHQFGELQWNRECDNLVWILYLLILTYAFMKQE